MEITPELFLLLVSLGIVLLELSGFLFYYLFIYKKIPEPTDKQKRGCRIMFFSFAFATLLWLGIFYFTQEFIYNAFF